MADDVKFPEAIYSPVRNVSYDAKPIRGGSYWKLTMKVEFDPSISPENAIAYSALVLQDKLKTLSKFRRPELTALLLLKVDELDLPCRAAMCLRYENIVYIGDLVQKTEYELLRTPNFGRKSLNVIKEKLSDMGLHLGMKIDNWPPECIKHQS